MTIDVDPNESVSSRVESSHSHRHTQRQPQPNYYPNQAVAKLRAHEQPAGRLFVYILTSVNVSKNFHRGPRFLRTKQGLGDNVRTVVLARLSMLRLWVWLLIWSVCGLVTRLLGLLLLNYHRHRDGRRSALHPGYRHLVM